MRTSLHSFLLSKPTLPVFNAVRLQLHATKRMIPRYSGITTTNSNAKPLQNTSFISASCEHMLIVQIITICRSQQPYLSSLLKLCWACLVLFTFTINVSMNQQHTCFTFLRLDILGQDRLIPGCGSQLHPSQSINHHHPTLLIPCRSLGDQFPIRATSTNCHLPELRQAQDIAHELIRAAGWSLLSLLKPTYIHLALVTIFSHEQRDQGHRGHFYPFAPFSAPFYVPSRC
ncbi:hypothetical protein F4823DRAFT_40073 [Ustulina deusta]|nr:hypothetical protein F4823DRAFT_40073 [Ustulina deusta]